MSVRLLRIVLLSASCMVAAAASSNVRAQGAAETPLTNAAVVKLVRAGFRERTVISIIRSRPARFDLTADRLIELKKGGVSEKIILAMIARDGEAAFASEDWDDSDDFFKEGHSGNKSADGAGRAGETNIFGSAGGARGRTRTNGRDGGSEGDTQTTGSATVRILRPPAESGGQAAAPKLERTPTLTNDSVVELVEAGFTEGTIIRRIEQSPAEFDLSAAKLAELRKRRVSEPVIAAMRAAMSDTEAPARPEN
ncbi:MAG TPA: hypothetical protein VGV59_18575 [Pyrinomonadaceae bacterium]|nr:hypothetical protein [Pyrinomonadaceae bacterium]